MLEDITPPEISSPYALSQIMETTRADFPAVEARHVLGTEDQGTQCPDINRAKQKTPLPASPSFRKNDTLHDAPVQASTPSAFQQFLPNGLPFPGLPTQPWSNAHTRTWLSHGQNIVGFQAPNTGVVPPASSMAYPWSSPNNHAHTQAKLGYDHNTTGFQAPDAGAPFPVSSLQNPAQATAGLIHGNTAGLQQAPFIVSGRDFSLSGVLPNQALWMNAIQPEPNYVGPQNVPADYATEEQKARARKYLEGNIGCASSEFDKHFEIAKHHLQLTVYLMEKNYHNLKQELEQNARVYLGEDEIAAICEKGAPAWLNFRRDVFGQLEDVFGEL